jgi:ATP-dependent Lon protease
VQQEADRGQREFFLREQLKAIQRELGERDPVAREGVELRARAERGMPPAIEARAQELERLEGMQAMSPSTASSAPI